MIGIDERPCKNFKRYKGVRRPTCGCIPCARKFFDGEKQEFTFDELKLMLDWQHDAMVHGRVTVGRQPSRATWNLLDKVRGYIGWGEG